MRHSGTQNNLYSSKILGGPSEVMPKNAMAYACSSLALLSFYGAPRRLTPSFPSVSETDAHTAALFS